MDQLLKESFRMDDKSLLERFQRAQTEIDDSQIPPEPEDGFERLLDKIEEKGIEPQYIRDRETESRSGKRRRLKPMLKVALVAAVVVGVMMATTLTVGAKKYFTYRKTVRASVRNDVVLNNDDNKDYEGRLEKAYKEIEQEIGIAALQLEYIPAGMKYIKTEIMDYTATMKFNYKENVFYVVEQSKDTTNSVNIISDRTEKEYIYNKWINQDIELQQKTLKNDKIEFSAEIIIGNTFYYLAGVMDKDEFVKIIENIYIDVRREE
nr:DUF4367 domain-containing protein [[Clostridium] symbiosum]